MRTMNKNHCWLYSHSATAVIKASLHRNDSISVDNYLQHIYINNNKQEHWFIKGLEINTTCSLSKLILAINLKCAFGQMNIRWSKGFFGWSSRRQHKVSYLRKELRLFPTKKWEKSFFCNINLAKWNS